MTFKNSTWRSLTKNSVSGGEYTNIVKSVLYYQQLDADLNYQTGKNTCGILSLVI